MSPSRLRILMVKGLKSKMVEFKAGANVTVEFTVEAN